MSSFICYEYQNKILHVEGKLGEKFRSHHKKKRFYPKHPKNITSNYFIHYQQVLIVPIYLNFCRKTESFVLSLFNHSLLDFICSATWAIVLSSPDCEFFLKKIPICFTFFMSTKYCKGFTKRWYKCPPLKRFSIIGQ